MKEVLLIQVYSSWQADFLEDELKKHHFKIRKVEKPREYTSILLGGSAQTFQFYIDELHFKNAIEVINKWNEERTFFEDKEVSKEQIDDFKTQFKKFLFLNCTAVIFFPIVFNIAATSKFFQLSESIKKHGKWSIALGVFIISWILSILEVIYFVKVLSS
ncbi:MAG: hypothetical protein L6Q37_07420 [Bdellovibrionaceae bacterium]|nr:hypothetical protein [Pseudobdellovibrionaceae bacterium]NUM57368.1 hypothetical protein [Pseudobdellovibrionaceae bacterium]